MLPRQELTKAKRIVIKVGTSTLNYDTAKKLEDNLEENNKPGNEGNENIPGENENSGNQDNSGNTNSGSNGSANEDKENESEDTPVETPDETGEVAVNPNFYNPLPDNYILTTEDGVITVDYKTEIHVDQIPYSAQNATVNQISRRSRHDQHERCFQKTTLFVQLDNKHQQNYDRHGRQCNEYRQCPRRLRSDSE